MSDSPSDSTSENRTHGIFFHFALLSLALLIVFPGFAWFGYRRSGMDGVLAASFAGVLCWAGASVALWLAGITRGTPAAVHATLLGMIFRMGPPLVVGIWLQQAGGQLARAGVFGMILCYYLWTLLVETLLSVRMIGESKNTVARV